MQETIPDPGRATDPTRSPGGFRTGLVPRLAAIAVAIAVAALVLSELREGFGLLRVVGKSLLPFATLVPLAAWITSRRLRDVAGTFLLTGTATAAMVACFAVFGLPVDASVLAPLLGVETPRLLALALGVALLLAALRAWTVAGSLRDSRIVTDSLFAVVEGVYFGGFLIGAIGRLGWPAVLLVAFGQMLAARARGVPFSRAIVGSGALVSVALWSGSAHPAIAVHLLLLGSSGTWLPRALMPPAALRRI